MIQIKNVSISFDKQVVLENISFDINDKETILVVGQSGCGKSVLMKIIAGLLIPDSGKVIIDGKQLVESSKPDAIKIRQNLAMLFQGSALLDSMNVFQNVALPLFEHTKLSHQEIEKLVKEKLALVGLTDILHRMPAELSGGMKKRVAFARAIITNPQYIIYDEPTTGLDPVMASEIISLISKLHHTHSTATVIVTHDLYCIEKISGRIVMLADNNIIFDGNYNNYKNVQDKRIKKFLYSTER
ncbi:MAG: ATP-binding cassette domain-containing protein [Candidatus Stygibacter australis]|nr:ATP-binding cassette domain-containing protein [Candidatus Stygibacter australis]MDP8320866.1 ATP-binding cassette domain-containing protein [Candidatus Stygibacter australis]